MRLTRLTLDGYRRFRSSQNFNLDCRVKALLGPNEAGKTSLLNALMTLNNGAKLQLNGPSRDLTRGEAFEKDHCVLLATFLLEPADTEAISDIPEAKAVKWAILRKYADGRTDWTFDRPIKRSLVLRQDVLSKLIPLIHLAACQKTWVWE